MEEKLKSQKILPEVIREVISGLETEIGTVTTQIVLQALAAAEREVIEKNEEIKNLKSQLFELQEEFKLHHS